MEWWMFLVLFLSGLFLVMALGLPIGFSFFVVNFSFIIFSFGLVNGASQLILSTEESLLKFSLTAVPFFILMGDLLMRSGIINLALDSLSKLLGNLPGRLSILSLGAGTLFAALSGSSMANTAMLGSTLIPEMRKQQYHQSMTYGPIMAAGTLAMVIPPSAMAVLLGSIGKIPIGPLLIAGILPGILLSICFMLYIVIRVKINPDLVPYYKTDEFTLKEKLESMVKYILPLSFIVFLVVGLIFLGVATPTESAALGALGSCLLIMCFGRLNKKVIIDSLLSTLRLSGAIMFIICGAAAFSQMLALTGATREMVSVVSQLNVSPIMVVFIMILVVIIMGMFLDGIAILMVMLPFFMPIIASFDFSPVWFGILMLITVEIGALTPPFGMLLFVMKSVAPKDTTLMDIYKSAMPFVWINIFVVIILLVFPEISTWLPRLMYSK